MSIWVFDFVLFLFVSANFLQRTNDKKHRMVGCVLCVFLSMKQMPIVTYKLIMSAFLFTTDADASCTNITKYCNHFFFFCLAP